TAVDADAVAAARHSSVHFLEIGHDIGQLVGRAPRPIHSKIYGAASWLRVLGGKNETSLRVLATAQRGERGELVVPMLKDDTHFEPVHHYGVAFSSPQSFARKSFVFMVVVTDDRVDADRLHLVQKALGYRGRGINRLDPRIGDAKIRRACVRCQ